MGQFTIHYASWDQLPPEFQETFARIIDGTLEEAEDFYRLYFYWFFVVHEMGHVLRQHLNTDTYRYGEYWREEQDVNDLAVAFWRRFGFSRWLERAGEYAERALSVLPNPVPDAEDPKAFFDANFESLVPQPQIYGYFQCSFVLRSLESALDFVPTLRRCIWENAVESDEAAHLSYSHLHADLPGNIIEDLVPILNSHAIDTPPVGVVKAFSPRLSYVVRHD